MGTYRCDVAWMHLGDDSRTDGRRAARLSQHAPTTFGRGAYVGAGSVIQPGSVISDEVHIMPLSLVMKGEQGFPPRTWWQGPPAYALSATLGKVSLIVVTS